MLRFAVFALVCVCLAQSQPQLKECHPSGNSVVKITNPVIAPYPPTLPGKIKVSLDVEITAPVDKFDVNVTLIKDIAGFPVPVPCLDNLGSCYYTDVCPTLTEIFPDGCPEPLTQCTCPFKANKLSIKDLEINLPGLPAEIAPIIGGKYEVFLSLQDGASKAVLSCLNVKFELATA